MKRRDLLRGIGAVFAAAAGDKNALVKTAASIGNISMPNDQLTISSLCSLWIDRQTSKILPDAELIIEARQEYGGQNQELLPTDPTQFYEFSLYGMEEVSGVPTDFRTLSIERALRKKPVHELLAALKDGYARIEDEGKEFAIASALLDAHPDKNWHEIEGIPDSMKLLCRSLDDSGITGFRSLHSSMMHSQALYSNIQLSVRDEMIARFEAMLDLPSSEFEEKISQAEDTGKKLKNAHEQNKLDNQERVEETTSGSIRVFRHCEPTAHKYDEYWVSYVSGDSLSPRDRSKLSADIDYRDR